MQAWYESATPSSRGRPQRYSDLAITTVLVIKRVFRLTLRAAQGFIDSIFTLMNGFVNGMVASHLLCHSGTINRHSLNGALLS
ncbi:hypothetical protein FK519_29660 [Klebsiella pneumoniae]|nr:hypothetical protein [Klebsiella pneumoniae]